MEIRIRDVVAPTLQQLNEISISGRFATSLQKTDDKDWENLFNFIRLNLQGRITGVSTPEEINKLQGKIEFIGELKELFKQIIRK